MAQIRCSCLQDPRFLAGSGSRHFSDKIPRFTSPCLRSATRASNVSRSLSVPRPKAFSTSGGIEYSGAGAHGGDGAGGGGGGGGGDGGKSGGGQSGDSSRKSDFGVLGFFINGWRTRVEADPQFPFKVLMEELVGVTACVIGDMASRPNFGLNELDFVFSTLVVGSILNFVLMYILAPTAATSGSGPLPAFFSSCPKSHMFESGAYSFVDRLGTFVYKGALFAAVGFAAGLVGTALSTGLIKMRKKMDPTFETPNKPPPTLLNAVTWASHMGVSSNLRYQTLNGLEFLLAKGLPPLGFKASVLVLRCLNNVLGGFSFAVLAKWTGSQKVEGTAGSAAGIHGTEEEQQKLLEREEDWQDARSSK